MKTGLDSRYCCWPKALSNIEKPHTSAITYSVAHPPWGNEISYLGRRKKLSIRSHVTPVEKYPCRLQTSRSIPAGTAQQQFGRLMSISWSVFFELTTFQTIPEAEV